MIGAAYGSLFGTRMRLGGKLLWLCVYEPQSCLEQAALSGQVSAASLC